MKKTLLLLAAVMAAACSKPTTERPTGIQVERKTPVTGIARAQPMAVTTTSPEALAAFERGRSLLENVRPAEAAEEFRKAIALDPTFALAHSYLGQATPGAEGLTFLEQGVTLAATLPESERLFAEALRAGRRGEDAKQLELLTRVAQLSPGDWRVHFALGQRFNEERRFDEATRELTKATELEPQAGPAWNTLGYIYLAQRKNDEAIASFQKYATLAATEPNPHDSLAEAYTAAGRWDESEAAYQQALTTSPTFWQAWTGIAQARFLRGNWTGGREALAKARELAPRPIDKLDTDIALAWSHFAEGDAKGAIAKLDAVEKAAATQGVEVTAAFAPMEKAWMWALTGKPNEALAAADTALTRTTTGTLPGGAANELRRLATSTRAWALAKLGRTADAQTALAELEQEAQALPDNARVQSLLHLTRGQLALAKGDAAGAATFFARCNDEDSYCQWMLVQAREQSGDTAGADTAWKALASANRRDPAYVYFHGARAAKPATASVGSN